MSTPSTSYKDFSFFHWHLRDAIQLGAFWTHVVSTSGLIIKIENVQSFLFVNLRKQVNTLFLARCAKMFTARGRLLTICVGLVNGPSRL